MQWDENFLNFHVDGTLFRSVTRQQVETGGLNGGVWAIDDPARIWIDSEIFDWMGVPPEVVGFSEDYEIDYVRTWQFGCLLGDCNQDGVTNFLDISPLIGSLTSSTYFKEAHCNEDDFVNFLDIAPFIVILTGS